MRDICTLLDDHGSRGVGDIAALLHGDIELDEVTSLKPSGSRHTVDDFVVDANQHGAGESVHHRQARIALFIGEQSSRHVVQLAGGRAGTRVGFEGVSVRRVMRPTYARPSQSAIEPMDMFVYRNSTRPRGLSTTATSAGPGPFVT